VPKIYREVRIARLNAGWEIVRQRGLHEVWAHPERSERVVVAGKNSATVPVGTLGSIRKTSGLEHLR
jgi:predicted RNA binding protein YcfA (HicA-like mRNA interferase family)